MKSKCKIAVSGDNNLAKEIRGACAQAEEVELLSLNDPALYSKIDVVIETINFDLLEKKQRLQHIENIVDSDTLIVTTVLGVSATEAASWLKHSERLIGFATFSNLEARGLLEIAPALQSNQTFLNQACDVLDLLGKEVEIVADEIGLVFPRIVALIINEAMFAMMEGTASPEDIDEAMKKGTNYPFGPLEWADNIGLEDVYAVLRGLHRDLGEERYRPAPLLRKMVLAGWSGKRVGKGIYSYIEQTERETVR
ncbi:3-hydroxyacyl-CoA dehydrogenase family protein [Bacillus taeanensis]|uniref:3-hydroxybutyryl-CoA dehydrogenase n=1 Tax=Bacillus taeanensis TaxID=273032 RepID=A0A366XX29_9BACI|nr:3-hydroxyacyl-CoA dehydrogenase family protein [Bacillus taeanensis]RBW70196.1 3-hydroxybutyryl-CoA dehydrogenase [Bacillus taeanensis]